MLRRLLASLLCHASRPVSTGMLIEALWEGVRPPSARKTLQIYIRRLRQAFGDAHRIVHGPAGYSLIVLPGELDAQLFAGLVERARVLPAEQALPLYLQALELWRGNAFAETAEHFAVRHTAERLEEQRLAAVEAKCAAELELGRHAAVAIELLALVEEHPFREGLREKLMLALYRSGRQAAALEVFREGRRLLAEELGVDPSPSLRRLHEAILRMDTDLEAPAASPAVRSAAISAGRPAQLPADLADFTGRAEELGELDALARPEGPAEALVIIAITGMAGAGKTALAVHWAHRVARHFPDGQLYLDLRGSDAAPPLTAAEALHGLLRSLGVEVERIPADVEEAAALYRSSLAGRRMLVVLDNAASAEQIRPLLPASARSLVLVTSRDRLTGLVARQGARRLGLPALEGCSAAELIARLVGQGRAAAEPEALARLVSACARLPLALRIAAATLADHPGRTVADHLAWLLRVGRLAALSIPGDEQFSLRAAFARSYLAQAPAEQRLFRLLGRTAVGRVSVARAAALAQVSPAQAAESLERLAAGHLIRALAGGGYEVEELLLDYARELSDLDPQAADLAEWDASELLRQLDLDRVSLIRERAGRGHVTGLREPVAHMPSPNQPPEPGRNAWPEARRADGGNVGCSIAGWLCGTPALAGRMDVAAGLDTCVKRFAGGRPACREVSGQSSLEAASRVAAAAITADQVLGGGGQVRTHAGQGSHAVEVVPCGQALRPGAAGRSHGPLGEPSGRARPDVAAPGAVVRVVGLAVSPQHVLGIAPQQRVGHI